MNTENNRNMPYCLPQAADLIGLKETRKLLVKKIEESWDKLHKAQKNGEDLKAVFTTIASLSEDYEVNAKRIYELESSYDNKRRWEEAWSKRMDSHSNLTEYVTLKNATLVV